MASLAVELLDACTRLLWWATPPTEPGALADFQRDRELARAAIVRAMHELQHIPNPTR